MSSTNARGVISPVNSTALRGVAAVMIMLGHLLSNSPPAIRFFLAGNLWVSMFFFYSGYGLKYSISSKEKYLSKIPKKMLKVYIPFLIAETAYTLSLVLQGKTMSLGKIIASCIGLNLANSTLWYVLEILVLYGIFYCIERWVCAKYHDILWLGLYGTFIILAVLFDIGTWWYISTFSFLLGMKYCSGSKFVRNYSPGGVISIFAVLYIFEKILTFEQSGVFLFLKKSYWIVAIELVLAPLFIFLLDSLLRRKALKGKILQVLGNASYEIYLLHMLVSLWMKDIAVNSYMIAIIVSVVTIILSVIFDFFCKQDLCVKKRTSI